MFLFEQFYAAVHCVLLMCLWIGGEIAFLSLRLP